eukprot:CAMPEP_0195515472 /NCGR_PEP_ID=MMETSP0794_2-20130614/6525_1 /TAXON_ID=515487 /ORGANISM="Stephanopyxis turris, Strain CCMP 815" /LENGTH=70 /DNA_ID=CAMNT_0040643895 /DNA_START=401 /DNA_END=613 /DNA_ORIENTATION=+
MTLLCQDPLRKKLQHAPRNFPRTSMPTALRQCLRRQFVPSTTPDEQRRKLGVATCEVHANSVVVVDPHEA